MRLSTLCLQASSCTYGTYGEAALEEVRIRSRSTGRLDRTIRPATRCGCSQYVDPGPGKILKAMMRRIDQDAWGKTTTLEPIVYVTVV